MECTEYRRKTAINAVSHRIYTGSLHQCKRAPGYGKACSGASGSKGREEKRMMLAEDLKVLNDSRKEMTEKGVKEAVDHD